MSTFVKKQYTLTILVAKGKPQIDVFGSKKTAVKYGEASGESFNVESPSGKIVHEYTRPIPDQGQATRTGASAKVESSSKEPKPTEAEVSLKHSVSRVLPGNYSIVTAPLVAELASSVDGVVTHITTYPDKLERRVDISSNSKASLKTATDLADKTLTDALAALKVWQKENIERRRKLTDMQRYLEHREFITAYGKKVLS